LYVENSTVEQCLLVNDDEKDVPKQQSTRKTNKKYQQELEPQQQQQQTKKQRQQHLLEQLAIDLHIQTKKAELIFSMLDIDQKGVVVLQDIQRAIHDVLDDNDTRNNLSYDDIVEMIEMFDENGTKDGLLYLNDLIKIARTVNL
jgi:hypothetical protein